MLFLWLSLMCYSLYKGLMPLWGRQIPYTMMKFGECKVLTWYRVRFFHSFILKRLREADFLPLVNH